MERDFRGILTPLTIRKPFSWDEAPLHRTLGEGHAKMLRELPLVERTGEPYEKLFDKGEEIEFVLRVDGRTFYVNTEGYAYARYVFEFRPELLIGSAQS